MSVNLRARRNTISVLKHDLGACEEVEAIIMVPPGSLNDVWVRPWNNLEGDLWGQMWFIEMFGEEGAMERANAINRAVDCYFNDLAKVEKIKTGKASHISRRVIAGLKCRLVAAQYPTLKSIVTQARGATAKVAKENLERLVLEGGQWLEK